MTVHRDIPTGRVGRILGQCAAELALDAHGDVLQLGHPAPRRYAPGATRVRHLADPAALGAIGPVDTVVSVCDLWRPVWTAERLGELAERLRPGGAVLFVEPVAVTGASGVAQRLLGGLVGCRHGLRFDRDVPGALRAAGLVPVAIDRTTADRRGRVRSFVVGTAVRG